MTLEPEAKTTQKPETKTTQPSGADLKVPEGSRPEGAPKDSLMDPLEDVRNGRASLQKGSKGPAVEAFQKLANEALGKEVLKPDGDFGKGTLGLVQALQNVDGLRIICGVKASGVVDQALVSALDEMVSNKVSKTLPQIVAIEKGDTLSGISKKFWGRSEFHSDLLQLNTHLGEKQLKVGDVVFVGPLPERAKQYQMTELKTDAELAEILRAHDLRYISDELLAPEGAAYVQKSVKSYSNYNKPIVTEGRLHGNSRIVGDAEPETQKAVIFLTTRYLQANGFTPDQIAYALASMKTESGFNPDAASNESASGLMQFVNETRQVLCYKAGRPDEGAFSLRTTMYCTVLHLRETFRYAEQFAKPGTKEFYAACYSFHHFGGKRDLEPKALEIASEKVLPDMDMARRAVKAILDKVDQSK